MKGIITALLIALSFNAYSIDTPYSSQGKNYQTLIKEMLVSVGLPDTLINQEKLYKKMFYKGEGGRFLYQSFGLNDYTHYDIKNSVLAYKKFSIATEDSGTFIIDLLYHPSTKKLLIHATHSFNGTAEQATKAFANEKSLKSSRLLADTDRLGITKDNRHVSTAIYHFNSEGGMGHLYIQTPVQFD